MKVVECDVPSGSMLSRELVERAYFRDSFRASLRRRDLGVTDIFLEPIRKLLESNESDVIPCQALDSAGERPMWKPEHRRAADRTGLRYPSDLSDAEWLMVEPMIPPAAGGVR